MGYQPDFCQYVGERIGVGGLSSVHELQLPGRQKLAVKISSANFGEQGKAFLRREANVLAQLDHPNIVRVHAYGSCPNVERPTEDAADFMVMDLLKGYSLDDYLRMTKKPFTPLEAFMVARQVAQALQAVHLAGYAYNDVKPANLVLTAGANYARKVMLIDFSLVERLGYLKPDDGLFRGTFGFAAPEKATGYDDRTDLRSDIFSLGMTIYNLIFNGNPLDPKTYLLDCRGLNDTIRRARLPSPAETALLRMTAFHIENRYKNCAEAIDAIDQAIASAG
jgi:serine/threonine-protein kinase